MRLFFSLFLCLLSITIGLSQSNQAKPSIMIGTVSLEDNNWSSRELSSKTASLLKKNYYVSKKAPLQLDIAATPGKAYTINGMDTYTVSDVEVIYTVGLEGSKTESKKISVKVKGTNERDLQRKIGTTISRDKTIRTEIIAFIDQYAASNLSSCSNVTTIIDQQLNANEPELAYASLAYYDLAEGCSDLALKQENKILDAIATKTCKSLLHDAEIFANGATIRDLTRATDKLLMIPPNSPCQEDVIRISQLVSTNAKEIGTKSSNDINIRLNQRQTQTQAEWRQYYRTRYYRRN